MVPDPMELIFTEDITHEKLNWLIEHVDEMVVRLEEDENQYS